MKQAGLAGDGLSSRRAEELDLGFLPHDLITQCRGFIAGYHEARGFAGLPDILWRHRLGPFIEKHRQLRVILRQASTTRSAKEANGCFVDIASAILAMEILVTGLAGWNTVYREAAIEAGAVLNGIGYGTGTRLLEFYLCALRHPDYSTMPAPLDLGSALAITAFK